MASYITHNARDFRSVETVPVIASFDADGHIRPLYVRIDTTAYKVDSYWIKCQFSNILEFQCKVIDGNRLIPVQLTYYQAEGVWAILT